MTKIEIGENVKQAILGVCITLLGTVYIAAGNNGVAFAAMVAAITGLSGIGIGKFIGIKQAIKE